MSNDTIFFLINIHDTWKKFPNIQRFEFWNLMIYSITQFHVEVESQIPMVQNE